MPNYGEENFKESNVNYLNKDFGALKESLMNYAKSYFPDTYRDFNETSPGMMLIEMNAYVGDVLSFYIDKQYQEMLLPLAEERRNIITMAKMFGYKVKPIVPAYVDLTFTSNVNADSNDVSKVDYSNASVFDEGIEIVSSTDSNIIFTTLDPIDFKITGSNDTETINAFDDSGLASTYTLSRTVRAMSATKKTISFQVGIPEKFKTLTISDTNVVDIISCIDSNGNDWYEVDFLAQDKVPIANHYTNDSNRESAYEADTGLLSSEAVSFSLSYIKTSKRFIRETNQDNSTSLVFGNGVLKNGTDGIDQGYIDMEQVGIVIPGQTNDLNESINPLLGNEYSTLGEAPNQTTLTITYRVGGGINSNVPSGDLTTGVTDITTITPAINGGALLSTVVNNSPARGGKDEEDTIEIKEKAKAFFSTQNRCVTKEDYEARVLNVPSKFGNIAKAYVTREAPEFEGTSSLTEVSNYISTSNTRIQDVLNYLENLAPGSGYSKEQVILAVNNLLSTIPETPDTTNLARELELGTINIYVLGYNKSKQLVGNRYFPNESLPFTLTQNIKNYLSNFKLMTDVITLNDGYIVNFGVVFDIIAEKYADKQQVKLNCIQKIKDYFRVEKMQFNQAIYRSQLEFELMGVEGVRSIGNVTITQEHSELPENTFTYQYVAGEGSVDIDGVDGADGTFIDASGDSGNGTVGYGYKYDFSVATLEPDGIIRPPISATPTVFELKNPNQNIQGRVR